MNALSCLLLFAWFISIVMTLPLKDGFQIAFDIVMFSSAIFLFRNIDSFEIRIHLNPLPFDRLSRDVSAPQVIHISGKKLTSRNAGYVYLLKEINGNHYKIGCTRDPNDRRKTFNVKLPFEAAYICLIPSQDMHALESALHYRFASKRVNGEWFSLSPADVQYIQSLAQDT
jgi:hypothetical protein